ncbi:uncharacterized protein MELLADRAFT_90037 [Melampsora larici-populina 98AG31]|uniref:Uncharacterized protein n=1 Tax=Melampsora larici-populina (strain 98AG31 / pathotype 3-4-7) TaxID=747676 RepID=F4RVI0_MELLP|nr:uncharacterized protein MELLADRAFT_90037 [Melampsora larici-populina 98AG31]EGG03666.1 hypothetical protein MELLADRAFT_90037 [Melampsora larici-populina 98AG31]
MCHWAEHGMLERSSSFKPRNAHMTFQTEWMTRQLLSRDEDNNVHSGGLLSNVTYKFFANGHLLSTSMYNKDLRRWIPILFTWLRSLTEEHYSAHFETLMSQIKAADMTAAERDTLVRQVVDFSAAQKNGFIMAYMEVFQETDRAVALDKLKGCEEHFRAQVTRVKRNRNIIPADNEFEKAARGLMKPDKPGGLNCDEKIAQMRKNFPKAKRWLEWWTAANIKAMIFKARPKRIDYDGLCTNMPATTNAQESLHRVYYMITPISEGNCTIAIGLIQLYALALSLERDHKDRLRGVPIGYGEENKSYKKVAQILGWSKEPRNFRETKSDGRPPDTTLALLGPLKKLGRPKGSTNIDRNPVTTYPGFSSSTAIGRQNQCWLNSMTECLYAVHTAVWYSRETGQPGRSVRKVRSRAFYQ